MNSHRTTPAPNAQAIPEGRLGIGVPRLPELDYFPNESVAAYIARMSCLSANRRQVAGWLQHEEPLG